MNEWDNYCQRTLISHEWQKWHDQNIRARPMDILDNILQIPLYPMQREIVQTFYDGQYDELAVCAGMRSGKSFMAAVIFAIEIIRYLLLRDPWMYYNIFPRSEVSISLVAVSMDQHREKSVWAHLKNIVSRNPYLMARAKITDTPGRGQFLNTFSIKFPDKSLTIRAIPSSSASAAGGTLLGAGLDEVARFDLTAGKRGADLVYDTLKGGTATLHGKIISVSSPMWERDKIMQLIKEIEVDDKAIAYHLASWELNPHFDMDIYNRAYRRNPEVALRDYKAQPMAGLEPFIRETHLIDQMVTISQINPKVLPDGGIDALERNPSYRYVLHGDPALINDAFGLCVGHLNPKNGHRHIDLLIRFIPKEGEREIRAQWVHDVILNLHKVLNIRTASFDTYQYPETLQDLERNGVRMVQQHILIEQYTALKEAIYAGLIHIPNHTLPTKNPAWPRTVTGELKELSLINGKKVDHPINGTKDVADALAGVNWLLTQEHIGGSTWAPRFG